MEELILEQKCGVSFQTKDPIKFNAAYGQYPGSGMTWVSWPMGKFRLYRDRIEIDGITVQNESLSDAVSNVKKLVFEPIGKISGTLKIPIEQCSGLYKKEGVIVIEHTNTTIPKHIWVATLFTNSFYKKLQKVVLNMNISIVFKDAPEGSDVRTKFDHFFKILITLGTIVAFVAAITIVYFFFKDLS